MPLKTSNLDEQSNGSSMFNLGCLVGMKYNQPVILKDSSAITVDGNQSSSNCHVYQANAIKEERFVAQHDNIKNEMKLNGGDFKLKQYEPHSKPYHLSTGEVFPLKFPYGPYGIVPFPQSLPMYTSSFPQGQFVGPYSGLTPMIGPMFGGSLHPVIPSVLPAGILV
jgi:hypothetical protein